MRSLDVTMSAADWAVIDIHLYFATTNELAGFEGNHRRADELLGRLQSVLPEQSILGQMETEVMSAPLTLSDIQFILDMLRNAFKDQWSAESKVPGKIPGVVLKLLDYQKGG